ncbi:N-acyl amino acid synthase FeeM domain-containing protein [Thermodesulfatator autotrophicus]|uniref:N-acyl amino acid synthase FeeM catalytic core domain-containing protein n=1 Tax=Thermodesulfatator autotrophicus TaxID=1795632 RepID=A0A177EAE0_9BACT|nr:hypothetical protein [Thermodesulfatator autotrophicus]OAG27979.1 hypothetical protein TH606_03865 [Thermodesulfatator autotrophicus]
MNSCSKEKSLKSKLCWEKRRFILSKIPDLVNKNNFRVKFASKRKEFLNVFSLVYDRYLKSGYIKPNEKKLFYTPYQALPDSRVCFAYNPSDKRILSTATIVIDSELGLPSDSIYKKEIDNLRSKGRKLAEISCLAAKHDIHYRNGIFSIFRLIYRYACQKGVTDFIISIRPKHKKFYEEILLFKQIGQEKPHKSYFNTLVVLERLDLTVGYEYFYKIYNEFPEGKIFADFFVHIDYLDDILELSKVRNMSAKDFWFFFMDYWTIFPSFPPQFQKFFSLKFDMIMCEEAA